MRRSAGTREEYVNEYVKYLAEKDDETVRALLRGIRTEREARGWLGAMNRLGVRDWRREIVVAWLRENT